MNHENIMNRPQNHKRTFKARTSDDEGTVLELATRVKNIPPNHFPLHILNTTQVFLPCLQGHFLPTIHGKFFSHPLLHVSQARSG